MPQSGLLTRRFHYSLASPRKLYICTSPDRLNWANFEVKADMKPFSEILTDALDAPEAESSMKRFDSSIDMETSEIIEFRQDLGYLPSK